MCLHLKINTQTIVFQLSEKKHKELSRNKSSQNKGPLMFLTIWGGRGALPPTFGGLEFPPPHFSRPRGFPPTILGVLRSNYHSKCSEIIRKCKANAKKAQFFSGRLTAAKNLLKPLISDISRKWGGFFPPTFGGPEFFPPPLFPPHFWTPKINTDSEHDTPLFGLVYC